MKDEKDGKKVM